MKPQPAAGLLAAALLAALTAGAAEALAFEAGDVLLRLRGIGIVPTDASEGIQPDLLGSGVMAQPMGVPELDLTYMITERFGVELIAATSPHDIDGEGGLGGLDKVGEVWLLPPTLLVQYHFLPDSDLRPYVGAGLNVTFTYWEDVEGDLETTLGGPTDLSLDNSIGWALQAGFDYRIDDRWSVNADLKYIAISVDGTLTTGTTKRTMEVDIDPIVLGLGVGYRF
jgi:outer membrane protein